MTNKTQVVAIALALLTVAAGCGNPVKHLDSAAVTAKNPNALALVFVDVSKSTYGKNGDERKLYASYFTTVVAGLPEGTLLKGDQIDRNPLSDTSLPIDGFIQKYGGLLGSQNKDDVDAENAATRTRVHGEFLRLLHQRPFGDSILDSLNVAQDVFNSFPEVKTKYLVIFSDMNETSARYKFTDANLTPDRVKSFIAKERQSGNLPDLRGVQVYVIGAGATRGSDEKDVHVRDVEQFWLAYVKATRASLPSYRYGPTLIRFP